MYEWLEPVYKPKMELMAKESKEQGIAIGEKRGEKRGRSEGIALGEKRGEKRGIALGEKRGIARGIISTMLDLGCGEPDIIDRLMLKLGCDRNAAARMIAEY